MTVTSGNLSELFGSIQGEGLYAGERHIFVRTAGCSITCCYCDTRSSHEVPDHCAVYGQGMKLISNPVDLAVVLEEVAILQTQWAPVAAVSITGGEPLEQSDFVAVLSRELQAGGFRTYLDTNGIEVAGLSKVHAHIDVVAADIKLPSCGAGDHWAAHRRFLRVADESAAEVFVKVVIDRNTLDDEVIQAIDIIAATNPRIPLVLQPESGALYERMEEGGRMMQRVIGYQVMAARQLEYVRVIPQIHRILGVR